MFSIKRFDRFVINTLAIQRFKIELEVSFVIGLRTTKIQFKAYISIIQAAHFSSFTLFEFLLIFQLEIALF